MEPGDVFGEIALIDGQPRTATATSLKKAELIVLERDQFLGLMEREPKIAVHLLKIFCERVRWTSELVAEAALLNARARLAKRLLSLSQLHGTDTDRGRQLEIAQSELAQFLSISRQIVNQHLQEWRRNGWVELSRSKIIICDVDALTRISEQTLT